MILNIKFDVTAFEPGVKLANERMVMGVREMEKSIDKAVILHQVNCMGAMGHGVAGAIRKKWPIVFDEYKTFVEGFRDRQWKLLGLSQGVTISPNLKVYNLFGQYDYGRDGIRRTEYHAFENALTMFASDLQYNYDVEGSAVLIPDLIGCGLAKGDRNVVMSIIKEVFKPVKNEIYICSI